jgi:(p)ppGpp synthase/HD superfamily hydrolase
MLPTLEDALQLALTAHRGQQDKAGQPYILHPLRLMQRMTTDETRIIALLHDVVEDTPITLDDLRNRGYAENVVSAIDALTRRPQEDYVDYVRRAKTHPLARLVKQADLEDNLDIRRLATITAQDFKRLVRYREAWNLLMADEA